MQWFQTLSAVEQALLSSLFMAGSTALGAAFVFFTRRCEGKFISALTGFAAGVMVAASFFSLLLPAIEYESALPAWLPVCLGFLLGGVLIVLGDRLFARLTRALPAAGNRKSALLFFAVTLHNIPEGLSVGVAFAVAGAEGGTVAALLLALGIGVQNFPEGTCVAFPLRAGGMRPAKCFLFSLLSGLVEIPAALVGALAAGAVHGLMPWALAFSAGAMISVVCSELIPECFASGKTVANCAIVLGFCVMMTLDLALG